MFLKRIQYNEYLHVCHAAFSYEIAIVISSFDNQTDALTIAKKKIRKKYSYL